MKSEIVRIEINFPVAVEVCQDDFRILDDIAGEICDRYVVAHPDRVMWPAGMGSKMTVHPLMLSDDEPIPFDDSVFSIDCAERENYDWLCEKCGIKQGDHGHCIIDPPAGDCEFSPLAAPKAEIKPRGIVPMHVYLSAVKGRSEMRAGLREARAKIKELEAALALAAPPSA